MKVQYTMFSVLPNTYKIKIKKYNIPITSLGEIEAYLDNGVNLECQKRELKVNKKDPHTVLENVKIQQLALDFE